MANLFLATTFVNIVYVDAGSPEPAFNLHQWRRAYDICAVKAKQTKPPDDISYYLQMMDECRRRIHYELEGVELPTRAEWLALTIKWSRERQIRHLSAIIFLSHCTPYDKRMGTLATTGYKAYPLVSSDEVIDPTVELVRMKLRPSEVVFLADAFRHDWSFTPSPYPASTWYTPLSRGVLCAIASKALGVPPKTIQPNSLSEKEWKNSGVVRKLFKEVMRAKAQKR